MGEKGSIAPEKFDSLKDSKDKFLEQLVWWADALKTARAK